MKSERMASGVRHLRVLDEGGVREACRQTYATWHQGRTLDAYTVRVLEALDRMRECMRYVGLCDGDRLIASARELDVWLSQDGETFRALGIAAVFVPEELRGRGLGRMLIRAFLDDARARGCGAALLFSDIGPAYYEAMGFRPCAAENWDAPVDALPAGSGLSLRPAERADARALMDMYHEALNGRVLGTMRSAEWWDYFRWWRGASGDYVLVRGGETVGYVNAIADQDCLHVYEWAAPLAAAEEVWAVVRRLAESLELRHVEGWWHPLRGEPWMRRRQRPAAIPMLARVRDGEPWPDLQRAGFEELDHF